jgi:hypothetical protein
MPRKKTFFLEHTRTAAYFAHARRLQGKIVQGERNAKKKNIFS